MIADCIVIGGGVSGLAAAVRLAEKGAKVVLFEQSQKLGGRCYSFRDEKTGDIVDNGQHVLVGAYKHTLEYLETIGTRSLLSEQKKLSLPFYHPEKGIRTFSVSSLPKPLHLTTGMLQFSLLSWRERKRLLKVGLELQQWNKSKEESLARLTVDEWLSALKQSASAKKCFWNPIAISVMNELPERASALLFARSLRATFLGKKSDSAILIPSVGQTELYVNSAQEYLKQRKATIHINTGVGQIVCEGSKVIGIETGERLIKAHSVISAVPYFALRSLLPDSLLSLPPFARLNEFSSVPIVSIHLWFDKECREHEFIGLIDMRLQWAFNRRLILREQEKKTSAISAVISGAYDTVGMTKEEIVTMARKEIQQVYPALANASLIHSVVIKEKRATFSPVNEAEQYRPDTTTPVKNLYLAGDWTNTGLPATIEGAIMSGFSAANLCLC